MGTVGTNTSVIRMAVGFKVVPTFQFPMGTGGNQMIVMPP